MLCICDTFELADLLIKYMRHCTSLHHTSKYLKGFTVDPKCSENWEKEEEAWGDSAKVQVGLAIVFSVRLLSLFALVTMVASGQWMVEELLPFGN